MDHHQANPEGHSVSYPESHIEGRTQIDEVNPATLVPFSNMMPFQTFTSDGRADWPVVSPLSRPLPGQERQYYTFIGNNGQMQDVPSDIMNSGDRQQFPPPNQRKRVRSSSMESQGETKQRHNDSERRRRNRINQLLEELRSIVPNCKMSKSAILEATTEYITRLRTQSAQLEEANRELAQENAEIIHSLTKHSSQLPLLSNAQSLFGFPNPTNMTSSNTGSTMSLSLPPMVPSYLPAFVPAPIVGTDFSGTANTQEDLQRKKDDAS